MAGGAGKGGRAEYPRRLSLIALATALGSCQLPPVLMPPAERLPELEPGPATGSPPARAGQPAPEAGTRALPAEEQALPAHPPRSFRRPGSDVQVAEPAPRPAPGLAERPGEVTLNFENTNLLEVVKVILGDLLGLNYTVDPRVKGGVTLQTSRPIPREALLPTLEMLLRMNGAALVERDGLYRVVPRELAVRGEATPQLGGARKPLPRGFGIRIVPLRYVAASEMADILEPLTLQGEIVRIDPARNLLVVTGTREQLARILEIIEIFDVDWLAGTSVGLFIPDFVDPKTLADELGRIFGERGKSRLAGLVRLVPIERLNALLVVTARREYLQRVAAWIDRLDRDSGGGGQRLFVYRVQNGKAADLAKVLNQVYAGSGRRGIPAATLAPGREPARVATKAGAGAGEAGRKAAPPAAKGEEGVALVPGSIRIIADEVNNALLVLATAQEYRRVREALKKLDAVPLQVLIEATIAEISLTGDLSNGLEWYFKNKLGKKGGVGTLDLGAAGIAAIAPGFSYAITGGADIVNAVLNTLASDSRANIVSSPSLMVLNNQKASIQVGDQVPVTTQQQQSTSTTANVINTIEFRDTGVLLTVTPRVNAGGLVTMEISQEVSDVAPGTGDSLTPTIQTRKIESTVAVESGQTVVLGGLIRDNRSESRSGIPGLYNLPVLGWLFGQRSASGRRTELVVLITPRAVRSAADAEAVTAEFRRKMHSLQPFQAEPGRRSSLFNQ